MRLSLASTRFPIRAIAITKMPSRTALKRAGATALAIDAGRTLLFDRAKLVETADACGIAIQSFPPIETAEPISSSKGMNKE